MPEDAPFEADVGRLSRQHSAGGPPHGPPSVITGTPSPPGLPSFGFGGGVFGGGSGGFPAGSFPVGGGGGYSGGGFSMGHAGIGGSGVGGSGLPYNPVSTRSDPVLVQRSRIPYAQVSVEPINYKYSNQ